jgi:hypothetical protein
MGELITVHHESRNGGSDGGSAWDAQVASSTLLMLDSMPMIPIFMSLYLECN